METKMETLEKKLLLKYFQDVLGVNTVFSDGGKLKAQTHVISIFHQKSVDLSEPKQTDIQELFLKMIQALNLSLADYRLFEISDSAGLEEIIHRDSFDQAILFCENPLFFKSIETLRTFVQQGKLIITYSPEVLLQKPELKKSVWNDIKNWKAL